ncbi:MAG TPA: DUF2723 domain-containing protein [Gemmatimonadales bacterium]|nr:DUF2723 domain-containing protein [Gemmatimonadales bacterium]
MLVAALVLAGYVLTLAPTVTLWDAGELITAAHGLGIPHPPGTPFFVLLGHVWGDLVAVGDYGWRLNLLSAVVSAVGAGCLFLCADRLLAGEPTLERTGGAAAAAVLAAFALTSWQNANESEVYGVATATIAAVCWLALRWRDTRGTPRAAHHLLLIVYLLALSVGNHLLALLVGPAVIGFVWAVLRGAPAADPGDRRGEWVAAGALAAVWVALVAVGLGQAVLFWGATALVATAVLAGLATRAAAFPVAAACAAAVGVSTYAYLYIRSGLDPTLDMADPETWSRLLAVIRREQYPPRSPLDNPLFASGPANPGRTPELFLQQLLNYVQYFDWQWARAVPQWGRVACTAVFATLGIAGLRTLAARDRAGAWLVGALWLVTGVGLVVYMNFKPGFSVFWDRYPTIAQHEVRERDYFFVASFQAWGVLAGLGLADLARQLRVRWRWGVAVLAGALIPVVGNAAAATRRGADAWLARDFAYDLLQSVGPYGIVFVLGDNDTYPLWYAQEVDGVRRDVSVVNLSLANTDWYLAQLRRAPAPFDPAEAPWYAPTPPPGPLLDVPEATLRGVIPMRMDRDRTLTIGTITVPFRAGDVLWPRDQVILLLLQRHLGQRAVGFAVSSGRGAWLGLERFFVQRGLLYEVFNGLPDTVPGFPRGLQGIPVDTARTRLLADSVYRYARLDRHPAARLEASARQIATTLGAPLLELAQARAAAGDSSGTLGYLRRAYRLAPSDGLAGAIRQVETAGVAGLVDGGAGQRP